MFPSYLSLTLSNNTHSHPTLFTYLHTHTLAYIHTHTHTLTEFENEDNSDLFAEEREATLRMDREQQLEYMSSVPGLIKPVDLANIGEEL